MRSSTPRCAHAPARVRGIPGIRWLPHCMVHTDVSGATGTSYPSQPYRAATNLESKEALCATNVRPRNNSASVPATSWKVGAPSTSAALMP